MVSIIHFQSSACSNMSLGLTNIIQQPWLWTHFYSPVGKHTNKQKNSNLFEHRCIIITTRIMYCIQQLQQLAPLAPLNKFSVHSWLFIQFYIQFQILFCSFNSVVGFGHDCLKHYCSHWAFYLCLSVGVNPSVGCLWVLAPHVSADLYNDWPWSGDWSLSLSLSLCPFIPVSLHN